MNDVNQDKNIDDAFLSKASSILADTQYGLSGSQIIHLCSEFAYDFDVSLPYPRYPFPMGTPNKKTVLFKNIEAFSPEQQFFIIKVLCENPKFIDNSDVLDLKTKLVSRYAYLSSESTLVEVDINLINDVQHWLSLYPMAFKVYNEAILKYENKLFFRNLIDDLRVSLEILCKEILGNEKSLENQISAISDFLSTNKTSKEINNMFLKLLDYFCKYNNHYIKHDDSVNEQEIDFILELTSSFMKYFIKLSGKAD